MIRRAEEVIVSSAVKRENLVTVQRQDVLDVVGYLSDPLTQQLNDCLKAALELP